MNEKYFKEAKKALENSYSPYSEFSVGCVLVCGNGSIYKGVNVENASFSATNCAERSAFFSAVSNGEKDFSEIYIRGIKKGGREDFCYPCGVCLQVMNEFCGDDFLIYLTNGTEIKKYTLKELLPTGFSLKGEENDKHN